MTQISPIESENPGSNPPTLPYLTPRSPVGATLHLEPYDPPTGPMP
jgi:hypothetical protein